MLRGRERRAPEHERRRAGVTAPTRAKAVELIRAVAKARYRRRPDPALPTTCTHLKSPGRTPSPACWRRDAHPFPSNSIDVSGRRRRVPARRRGRLVAQARRPRNLRQAAAAATRARHPVLRRNAPPARRGSCPAMRAERPRARPRRGRRAGTSRQDGPAAAARQAESGVPLPSMSTGTSCGR